MPTLERMTPYLESLLEDEDVQNNLRRAGARFSQARSRAGKRRSKRAAARDPRVWTRVREGAAFGLAALSALQRAPERRSSSHRLRWALLITVVAAAAFVAYDDRARTEVLAAAQRLRGAAPPATSKTTAASEQEGVRS